MENEPKTAHIYYSTLLSKRDQNTSKKQRSEYKIKVDHTSFGIQRNISELASVLGNLSIPQSDNLIIVNKVPEMEGDFRIRGDYRSFNRSLNETEMKSLANKLGFNLNKK